MEDTISLSLFKLFGALYTPLAVCNSDRARVSSVSFDARASAFMPAQVGSSSYTEEDTKKKKKKKTSTTTSESRRTGARMSGNRRAVTGII